MKYTFWSRAWNLYDGQFLRMLIKIWISWKVLVKWSWWGLVCVACYNIVGSLHCFLHMYTVPNICIQYPTYIYSTQHMYTVPNICIQYPAYVYSTHHMYTVPNICIQYPTYVYSTQQDATTVSWFYCKITVHVSGTLHTHHQEYNNCSWQSLYNICYVGSWVLW
jgi:hypothetical protein